MPFPALSSLVRSRIFTVSSKRGYIANAGTLLNPKRPLKDVISPNALNTLTKSIFVVSTPQYANELSELVNQFPNTQIYGAAVDTVGFGGQRNGFSWMVFEDHIEVENVVKPEMESTSAKQQWTMHNAAIKLVGQGAPSVNTEISLPVASTLFTNGLPYTIVGSHDLGPVAGLQLKLPLKMTKKDVTRPLTRLTGELTITSSVDNMLKLLDDQAAASFLEKCESQISDASDDRAVFAEITSQRTGETTMIKVIAGGGGLWSARSRMLVLEPPYRANIGDKISFHLYSGKVLSEDLATSLRRHHARVQASSDLLAAFEVSPILHSLDEKPFIEYKRNEFIQAFAAGSEHGFLVGEEKHSVPCESQVIGLSN